MRSLALLLLLAASPLAAQPAQMRILTSASELAYDGTSALHDWTGVSDEVTGTLALDLGTPSRSSVQIAAPVASFDSGNRRRDRKMREVTEAARFPTVRFTSTRIEAVRWSGAPGARTGRWRATGRLELHGVARIRTVVLDVAERGGRLSFRGAFDVALADHGIERPGVGPVKIGRTIRVRLSLVAQR